MNLRELPAPVLEWIEEIARRFESAWQAGSTPPRVVDFLGDASSVQRLMLILELVRIDIEYRNKAGVSATLEAYALEFPELRDADGGISPQLRQVEAERQRSQVAAVDQNEVPTASKLLEGTTTFFLRCRQCEEPLPAIPSEAGETRCPKCGAAFRYGWADTSRTEKLPTIADHQIQGVLGKGGMGIVYKAHQVSLRRTVAIKMILGGSQVGDSRIARFRQEALALAQLQHPNTVQIFEIGEHDGCPFFTMEYVNGGSLSQKLTGKPMPPNEAAGLLQTLARAMHAAHQKGIIHRDLKPANVMIADDGTPKVTDFGLAKQLDADQALSQAGDIMGTPSYMAPEQASGRIDEIGPATDIYSLGAILYETLTGRPPFKSKSTIETLELVRNQEPTPPRAIDGTVPRDLETICLKCLHKEPTQRYHSALALAQDLERFLAGEAILAKPEGMLAKVARKIRRHRAVAALGMALFVALLAAAVIGYQSRQSRRIRDIETRLEADRAEARWSDDAIREHEELIAQLASYQSERSTEARESFHESLLQSASKRLKQATALAPEDDAEVRRIIALLESRSAAFADKLRGLHQTRLRDWEEVFAYSKVASADPRLQVFTGFRRPSATILTNHRTQGNVRLEAIWDSWRSATQIGLTLNGDLEIERTGYAFVLNANSEHLNERKKPSHEILENLRTERESVTLSILRNGVLLRSLDFSGTRLPNGPLRMEAERVGDRLRVHVQGNLMLEARDVIPLPTTGFYGVVLPANSSLASLRGLRQALPISPGPLEQGDDLFAQGRFEDARLFFSKQAIETAGVSAGYEARFKEALTLEHLSRTQDAVAIYELLTAEMKTPNANRWTVLAAFQLWAHYLKIAKRDEAAEVGERLLLQQSIGRGEKLAAYIPDDVRARIRGTYRWDAGSFGMLRYRPKRLENIQQLVKLEELLETPTATRRSMNLSLMRAQRFEGNLDQALRVAQQELRDLPAVRNVTELPTVAEYAWIMREKGLAGQALKEIDARLFDKSGKVQRAAAPLLIERGRLNAALKKWADAKSDLDAYFADIGKDEPTSYHWLEACLVLGMIHEQQEDMEAARATWLKGYTKATAGGEKNHRSGHFAVNEMMLAMLCQKLDEKHLERVARPVLGNQFDLLLFLDAKKLFRNSAIIMNRATQSPKVMDLGRRMVLQTCTLREYVHFPAQIMIVEIIRDDAFKGKCSDEQEQVLWKFAEVVAESFSSGKMTETQAMQIFLLWKRGPSILAGLEIVQKFDPALRGPGAYFMGHRFQQLARPAEQAFLMASKAAAPNSALERLVRVELEKLKKAKAK